MKTPVLRYHGGKYRLANWIIGNFPEHIRYVEAFGGAASILLRKDKVASEVYNDLCGEVVNLFTVLRNKSLADELIRQLRLTPYSREEFTKSYIFTSEPIERARRTIVRSIMGFATGANSFYKTNFRSDSRRNPSVANHWSRYPDSLASVVERMQGVLIENLPAVDCIAKHDGQGTLIYMDPPYEMSVRKVNRDVYSHELTDQQHSELLAVATKLKSMVVISGYDNELYNDLLTGWNKETKSTTASGVKGSSGRIETIWLNPQCVEALKVSKAA